MRVVEQPAFRCIALVLALMVPCFADAPRVSVITNGALPAVDLPPGATLRLAPRSIATIFGSGLADSPFAISAPWQPNIAGTEVHLVVDSVTTEDGTVPCSLGSSNCELITDLIYVSPTQINFVAPDVDTSVIWNTHVVIIRNGARYDAGSAVVPVVIDGTDPIEPIVFGVGYDCLFSFSSNDPSSCGVSWSKGQNRATLGAVTDFAGKLVTSQNPVRQGELITLWMTGLTGLTQDQTGSLRQKTPAPISFGVAQGGKDIDIPGGFSTPVPSWAGESPQYPGLDQVNTNFPACSDSRTSAATQKLDAFLQYPNGTRVYVPFVVRPGDPDCLAQWATAAVALTSSINPSNAGQTVTFKAVVLPSTATGSVTFIDGNSALATVDLDHSQAAFATSDLSPGSHAIAAVYSGDTNYKTASSTGLIQTVNPVVKSDTTTTIAITPASGGAMFEVHVSPPDATGTITFLNYGNPLCPTPDCAYALSGGKATVAGSVPAGANLISAKYGGNLRYNASTSTAMEINGTSTALTSSPNPAQFNQIVVLTASVSPPGAMGTVTFMDSDQNLGSSALDLGQATFTTSSLAIGPHALTAIYSGDGKRTSGSISGALNLTVTKTAATMTVAISPPNITTYGAPFSITATVSPATATGTVTLTEAGAILDSQALADGKASFNLTNLSVGTHVIAIVYNGDGNTVGASSMLTHTVTRGATNISLTASDNPAAAGELVTFTATVSPPDATGTITFSGFAADPGCNVLPVINGKASCAAIATQALVITAAYSGDKNYAASAATVIVDVQ